LSNTLFLVLPCNTNLAAEQFKADGTVNIATMPDCGSVTSMVNVTVINPTFNGVVYLAGEIRGNAANVTDVEVKSLNATCDSISTTYDPQIPQEFQSAQAATNEFISVGVKTFLSKTLVGAIQLAIEEALKAARQSWSLFTGFGWMASFARANAASGASNFLKYGLGFGGE
jgi:hypothetical protein